MRLKKILYILPLVLTQLSASASLKVSPMYVDLGTNKSAEIIVENVNSSEPLDVSFLTTKEDGLRARGYLIYPPLIKGLNKGERRTARVIRKTPSVDSGTYVDVKTLNDSYKVNYRLLVIDGNKK